MIKITDPRQITELAKNKKAVYDTRMKRHFAAAFIQNYQLVRIIQMIDAGYLYVYEPKEGGTK